MAHAEIEGQILFFSFSFARVTEVRHIYCVTHTDHPNYYVINIRHKHY